ncbi:MAG TPA: HAMP domain-containing protein, partial [Methylophaga sp.]|nr:HAMP domain-containing protein [Methylophaga sp.]
MLVMFKTWSIKSLLQLWSLVTIVAILVIAAVALYSNILFSHTQHELTSHVLPMENASREVSRVAASFITRQKQIIVADSISSISALMPRQQLEAAFEKELAKLRIAVADNQQGASVFTSLFDYYQRFLAVDTKLLALNKQRYVVNNKLQQQLAVVDLIEVEIHDSIETISDQINRNIKKNIIQKHSQSVQFNVLRITHLTHTILQAKNAEQLENIRDNQIKQYQAALTINTKQLKMTLQSNKSLFKLVQRLDEDVIQLIQTISLDQSSVYQLRLQQLENQHVLALAQQESAVSLNEMMSKLNKLLALVSDESLNTVTQTALVAERARWIIVLLATMIVLGILRFIIVISERINKPLAELSNAMQALSAKNFTTRLVVKSSNSEFGVLAKDFNLFAENTQKLIYDLAEAKDSLQIGKQHLTAILNSVPEAILTVSTSGVIESSNDA